MTGLIANLPGFAKKPLIRLVDFVGSRLNSLSYYGNQRFCPVCGKSARRFRTWKYDQYVQTYCKDAQCIYCGAFERHRFLWLFVKNQTNLFNGQPKKMLHVAPEPCFEPRLRSLLGNGYITADLSDTRAMVKMDITNIQFPARTFDVIICSHVLEHVREDRKAMREFQRVLKDDGWALLLVPPILVEKTLEDPAIVDPQERVRVFWSADHVRLYGLDYVDRLREAGFKVNVAKVEDLYEKSDATRMGLTPASGEIYYCTKKA